MLGYNMILYREKLFGRLSRVYLSSLIYCMCEMVYRTCNGDPNYINTSYFFNSLYLACEAYLCYGWTRYCADFLKVNFRHTKPEYIVGVMPVLINAALAFSAPWTGLMFRINADGVYERSTGWILPYIICGIYLLASLIMCLQKRFGRKMVNERFKCIILMHFNLVFIIMVIIRQFLKYNIPTLCVGIAVALFFVTYYTNTMMYREKDRELLRSRTQSMVSQIQPHFIFNVLNIIYYLCGKDPKKAQDAVSTFADYLRVNLDSIGKLEPIPFQDELNHVKTYLKLEEMRFGEKLKAEYDIQEYCFTIPALTLQPIVENAVKHGIRGKQEGGTIYICSKRQNAGFEITVKDTGIGFDVDKISEKPGSHVGIENVRTRLNLMSEAKLDIMSVVGKGTIVHIFVPEEKGL